MHRTMTCHYTFLVTFHLLVDSITILHSAIIVIAPFGYEWIHILNANPAMARDAEL